MRCEEILTIQAMGLKKRLAHAHAKSAVVGISGGLDSTLALLVSAKAFDALGMDRSGIVAVTMPCFGTTDRTYQNACKMSVKLGATLREIPVGAAVEQHFKDIGHDPEENSGIDGCSKSDRRNRDRNRRYVRTCTWMGNL